MNNQNNNDRKNGAWIAGALLALTASMCCITPLLALISGVSGIAATFSWLEPARPYLIGLTTLVLGFAWYQKLKPRKPEEIDCDCEEEGKTRFWQSKSFLGIVTIVTIALLAFPSYSHIFYPKRPAADVIFVETNNVREVQLNITGMTCQGCSEHVNHALDQINGVLEYHTSHEEGKSIVKFDRSKTTEQTLIEAINATGYKVTETKAVKAD
jgi:mercuric ion transport protein